MSSIDDVTNVNPRIQYAVATSPGAICTADGSPGTWKARRSVAV